MRVGPVPTDWSLARVKDALFQIGQVDVAYVGKTAADGTVIASYRDGATAEAAVRALAGKTLVSGGPAISASVVTSHRNMTGVKPAVSELHYHRAKPTG